ncbi:TPA: hypothetical protein RQO97_004764, partial [Klebsiella michiganensis]|nr:hypothetical protein [Klebsiella michiganensis]
QPVAPVSAARSPAKRSASREEATPMHHPDTVPEAALRACPGKQVAEYFRPGLFPARGVNALAGLPDRRRG